jgi:hypothetical protein
MEQSNLRRHFMYKLTLFLLVLITVTVFTCSEDKDNPCDDPANQGCGSDCYDELGVFPGTYCWKDSLSQDSCCLTAKYRICVRCIDECEVATDFEVVEDSVDEQNFLNFIDCVLAKDSTAFLEAMWSLFDTTKAEAFKNSGFDVCKECK